MNYIVGDEGVYSSIEDMVKWNRAWDEEILAPRKMLNEAMTPARLANGKMGKAGFSWLIRDKIATAAATRWPRNDFWNQIVYQDGAWVGFRNIMLKIPSKNITVVVLSNRNDLNTETERLSLAYRLGRKFF